MSIAYDFEPDVSPIYDDEFEDDHSVHFSSYGTPKSRPSYNKTLGSAHMDEGRSEVVEDSDEIVPDSTVGAEEDQQKVLHGTFIVISAGCCHPIKRHFIRNLEEMGANIQVRVDAETTHVVIDRYADSEVLREAMHRQPHLSMVDVKWIQECIDKKMRIQEKEYSMNDCHYLKQSCRRLSTNQNYDQQNESDFLNMTTSDLVEFIDQIKSLSERLDALMNYNPLIRFAYHSPDCPTRRRPTPSPAPEAPRIRNVAKIRKNINEMSQTVDIKRRRSFSGFVYAHRKEAVGDILRIQEENRDTRETWEPEKIPKNHRSLNNRVPLNTINDMRKTMPTELPAIHETYRNNANLTKHKSNIANKTASRSRLAKERRKPVNPNDDPEIQKALNIGALTINSSPDEMPRPASSRRKKAPLVVTKSKPLNDLMIFDSNDFISDVSGIRKQDEVSKNQIVFTGFGREDVTHLKNIAQYFDLSIMKELDEKKTKCVISRDGRRTLLVIKSICLNIPIVKPIWLEECGEDSKLLDIPLYEYPEWKNLLKKRKSVKISFSQFNSIFVTQNCNPNRSELSWLINKCGGTVSRKLQKCGLIVAGENEELENICANKPVVNPIYLIDSITNNECLPVEDYSI